MIRDISATWFLGRNDVYSLKGFRHISNGMILEETHLEEQVALTPKAKDSLTDISSTQCGQHEPFQPGLFVRLFFISADSFIWYLPLPTHPLCSTNSPGGLGLDFSAHHHLHSSQGQEPFLCIPVTHVFCHLHVFWTASLSGSPHRSMGQRCSLHCSTIVTQCMNSSICSANRVFFFSKQFLHGLH